VEVHALWILESVIAKPGTLNVPQLARPLHLEKVGVENYLPEDKDDAILSKVVPDPGCIVIPCIVIVP